VIATARRARVVTRSLAIEAALILAIVGGCCGLAAMPP
jgi:methionine synthase I (cobalamin-dependent)